MWDVPGEVQAVTFGPRIVSSLGFTPSGYLICVCWMNVVELLNSTC